MENEAIKTIVKKCEICGIELPDRKDDGRHNFVPLFDPLDGKIKEVCLKCKMREVVLRPEWHEFKGGLK